MPHMTAVSQPASPVAPRPPCRARLPWMTGGRAFRPLALLPALGAACGVSPEPLMVTPLIYVDGHVDPFDGLAQERRTSEVTIFFASNREPFDGRDEDDESFAPSNVVSAELHLGTAEVRLGDEKVTWDVLETVSRSASTARPPVIELLGATWLDTVPVRQASSDACLGWETTSEPVAAAFLDAVNAELNELPGSEIVIYIHGAKVDFYNACAFTAEIEHFLGRRFVPIAFSWPTHQNIFSYLFREDVRRAEASGAALTTLLGLLADGTTATRIHLVCWSAGARVASAALMGLAEAGAPDGPRRHRLGTVVFELPDVELSVFLDRLPLTASVAERTVVTVTDDDEALSMAEALMGGGPRAGKPWPHSDQDETMLESLRTVEFIDLSWGKKDRGFNIAGHRCWFRHPWGATDLIMVLRFDLPAEDRGLVETDLWRVWALPSDYPQRVRDAASQAVEAVPRSAQSVPLAPKAPSADPRIRP